MDLLSNFQKIYIFLEFSMYQLSISEVNISNMDNGCIKNRVVLKCSVEMLSNRFDLFQFLMRSKIKFIFAWSWTLALSLLIVGKGFPPIMPLILIFLSMIFVVSSVYLYNDIFYREMDKENVVKKNRPIVSARAGEKFAK